MTLFRLRLLALAFWYIFLFNLERLDFNFLGLTNINLDTWVYILAAIVGVAILILPDLSRSLPITFVPTLLVYGLIKITRFGTTGEEIVVYLVITEILTLFLTIIFTRQVALAMEDFEQAVETVLIKPNNMRVLSEAEGEEKINFELFRARRFERPVGFLLIQLKSVQERMGDAAPFFMESSELPNTNNAFDWESMLNERLTQLRVAKVVESLIFKVDTMVWNKDDLVICLPETNREDLLKLAHNIYNQLNIRLQITPLMGIATFPQDGLIYRDLLEASMQNLVDFGEDTYLSANGATAQPALFRDPSNKAVVKKQNQRKRASQAAKLKGALSRVRRYSLMLVTPPKKPHLKAEKPTPGVWGDLRDPDFWIHNLPYQSMASRLLYRYVKRAFDLFMVFLVLPASLFLMIVISILIKLEDGGDIFYTQERTGLGGRRFKMYKFRSMVMNAPTIPPQVVHEPDGKVRYIWPEKMEHDPRITRIGRILRKTSLDELPQLINVLKGDMSLVGPRPTSWDLDKYTLLQTERLTVRPGITGLWQVSARESKNPDERLMWDTAYIDKLSLWLDIQIIWRTVTQVMQKRGV